MLRKRWQLLAIVGALILTGCGEDGETRLESRVTISGQVLLEAEDGLNDFGRVRIDLGRGEGGITPDGTGAFALSDLEPDVYTLTATYVGSLSSEAEESAYRPYSTEVVAEAGGSVHLGQLRLELGRGSVAGSVGSLDGVDASGQARVLLVGTRGTRETQPDAGGSFRFEEVPVGHYRVAAERAGATSCGAQVDVLHDGDAAQADAPLLSTTVALAPAADAGVSVYGDRWYLAAGAETVDAVVTAAFAAEGRTWAEGAAVPNYAPLGSGDSLRMDAPEVGAVEQHVQVRSECGFESPVRTVVLVVDEEAPVIAQVQLDGGARATRSRTVSLTVTASDAGGDPLEMKLARCAADEDGAVSCAPTLAEASWEPYAYARAVTFEDEQGDKAVRVLVRDRSGNTSDVAEARILYDSLPPQDVRMRIDGAAEDDPEPVVHTSSPRILVTGTAIAQMRLGDTAGLAEQPWQPFQPAFTYTFVGDDGLRHLYARFRDAAGNETEELELTLRLSTRGALSGTLLLEGAADHAGTMVALLGSDQAATTDEHGRWSLPAVPARSYTLRATHEGYAPLQIDVLTVLAGESEDLGVRTLAELDLTPPQNMALQLGDGSGVIWTASPMVRVSGEGATEMLVGTLSGLAGLDWQPLQAEFRYDLPEGDGLKRLYARFRDAAGNETAEISAEAELRTTGTLHGVVRLGGEPLDHAGTDLVLLGTAHQATTDAEGSWTLGEVPAGGYLLQASHPGYEPHLEQVVVSVGVDQELVEVVLPEEDLLPPQDMAIRIGDGSGVIHTRRPLVTVSGEGATEMKIGTVSGLPDAGWQPLLEVFRFEFDGQEEGLKVLYARFRDAAGNETGELSAEVELRTTGGVSGRVLLEGATAHAGVAVSLLGTEHGAATDEAGAWRIEAVPAGAYRLRASLDGYAPYEAAVLVSAGVDLALDDVLLQERDLLPPQGMALVVGDGTGIIRTPMPLVTVQGDDAAEMKLGTTSGLASASWQPFLRSFRFQFSPEDGPKRLYARFRDAAGNETEELDAQVQLRRTGSLRGVFRLADALDHGGIAVVLLGTEYGAMTDAEGSWALDSLPPGTYQLQASLAGYARHRQEVDVQLDVTLDLGEQSLGERDETPPQNMALQIGDGSGMLHSSAAEITITGDEDPAEMLLGSEEGLVGSSWQPFLARFTYQFSEGDGVKHLYARFRDAAGNETSDLHAEATLSTLGGLTGSVLLNGAQDHSGALVQLVDPERSTVSAPDGSFTLDGLEPGIYDLVVSREGYRSQLLQGISVPVGTLHELGEIPLAPYTGQIEGWAVLEGQTQHGGVELRVGGTDFVAYSDATGYFSFEVPPGSYDGGLLATKAGYEQVVGEGETITVTRDGVFDVGQIELRATHNTLLGWMLRGGEEDHAGLEVVVEGVADSPTQGEHHTTETDGSGAFRFDLLPLGSYDLTVRDPLQVEREVHRVSGLFVQAGEPTVVPTATLGIRYLFIEGDAAVTTGRSVTLTLGASDCLQMQVSNLPDLSDAGWRACADSVSWMLTLGEGTKTVYARFLTTDAPETPTGIISDTIHYDGTAQISEMTFTPSGVTLTQGDTVHFRLVTAEPGGWAQVDISGYDWNLPLYDDGTHGDQAADDGVYELDYVIAQDEDADAVSVTGEFFDPWGNSATLSAASRLTIAVPPEITDLEAYADSERGVVLLSFWTSELSTTRIRWGASEDYTQTIEGARRVGHSFELAGPELVPGGELHIEITATDDLGAQTTLDDLTVPVRVVAPGFFAAFPGDGRAHLRWEAPAQDGLQGYAVFRAEAVDGPWVRLNPDAPYDHEVLLYEDDTVANGTTYYYQVAAIDSDGLEGVRSPARAATPDPPAGPTPIQGALMGYNAWSQAGSPYVVTGNVALEPGGLLAIGPDVEVLVDGDFFFRIQGRLAIVGARGEEVDGAESDAGLVTITSAQEQPGRTDWQGIELRETTDPGRLDFATRRYLSGHLIHRARISDADVVLRRVDGNRDDGIWEALAVLHSELSHCGAWAFQCGGRELDLLVQGSLFTDGVPEGQSDMLATFGNYYSQTLILDSTFSRATDPYRYGDNYSVRASYSTIRGCTFSDNDDGGLYMSTSLMTDSFVLRNGGNGLKLSGTAIRTDVLDNEDTGVVIDTGANKSTALISSTIRGNGEYGASLAKGWVVGCDFADNGQQLFGGNKGVDLHMTSSTTAPAIAWGNTLRSSISARQYAATPYYDTVFRFNHLLGTVFDDHGTATGSGYVLAKTSYSTSIPDVSDNSYLVPLAPDKPLLATDSSSSIPDMLATGCYWGPEASAEIAGAAEHPANLSFLYDSFDEEGLHTIDYSGWRVSALPLARITGPNWGSEHVQGTELVFVGTATDPEDGPLDAAAMVWQDGDGNPLGDVDDVEGSEDTLVIADLPVGKHFIHLVATDSDGQAGEILTEVDIVAP